MDNYPKINWISSPDTEMERIVHATKVAASGFYVRHGFVVTPKVLTDYPEACVVIPDLGYDEIPNYYQEIEKIPLQFPLKVPQEIKDFLRAKMGEKGVGEKILSERRTEWEKIEKKWWEEVGKILSEEVRVIGEIEVRLTKWGTISSNTFANKRKRQKVIIYLRQYASISHLPEAILNAILYAYRNDMGASWSKREAIIDFLLSRQSMKKILPNYKPTLANLGRIPAKMRDESARYCERIGIPRSEDEMARIKLCLTKREGEIAQLLWNKRGEIVSFDAIADLLWGEGEFKTFWAINKMIQRMRVKLTAMGVDASKIKTKRGRGYIWI